MTHRTLAGAVLQVLLFVGVLVLAIACDGGEESYTPPPATIIRAGDEPEPTPIPPAISTSATATPLPMPPTIPPRPPVAGAGKGYPYPPHVIQPATPPTPIVYPSPTSK